MKEVTIILTLLMLIGKTSIASEQKTYGLQDSSMYTLEISDTHQKASFIDIQVFDVNRVPVQAMIGLRNHRNSPLLVHYADKNGASNSIIFDFKKIEYLSIEAVGYYRVLIPISKVKNRNVKLVATLIDQHTVN